MRGGSEAELQIMIAQFIRRRWPGVIFHSDYGSGVKLTVRQASVQKAQNGGLSGYPDLFVAEPIGPYHGLFIELKKEGVRIKKKNGEWANDHIDKQAEMLERLRFRGYRAEFAVGFDEARKLLESYMMQ